MSDSDGHEFGQREGGGLPRWAKSLRNPIVGLTILVLAGAGLLAAIGKAGEAYDHVCKVIPICPKPKLAWHLDDPASITQLVTKDTPFSFPSLAGASPTGPEKGNQRYGTASPTCAPIRQNAWLLHDGTTVLEDNSLIANGWTSPSYVGEPEGPDWSRFDNLARDKFGWTPGFATNQCSRGNRCKISSDDIKLHSTPMSVLVNECSRFHAAETNSSINKASLTVWIRGASSHGSMWTVTAPVETFREANP